MDGERTPIAGLDLAGLGAPAEAARSRASQPAPARSSGQPARARPAAGQAGGAARARAARTRGPVVPAEELPVARVVVDTPLAHLDRPFDYLVPAEMADTAVPGSRVRVRFAGRLADGFVLERRESSDHPGRLSPLVRSVSAEPVLSEPIARLARAVADRYAGTMADVLRLAVPPRHAQAEAAAEPAVEPASRPAPEAGAPDPAAPGSAVDPGQWRRYPDGPSFLAALAAGRSPRAIWWAPPGPAWPGMIATAAAAALASGRGVLVVVPDHRDADRVAAACRAALTGRAGDDELVVLRADLGPSERYRRFLAVRRGRARVVVGTRAAIFAPVADLGLVVVWDDGDDLHAEPRAPYPHTRDVAVLRARLEGCATLIGGFAPSVEADALARVGWAGRLVLPREAVRQLAPRVEPVGSDFEAAIDPAARAARLPSLAVRTARAALAAGAPVLIQVPRRGYHLALACADCRQPARCRRCSGPLGRAAAQAALACRWCGRRVPVFEAEADQPGGGPPAGPAGGGGASPAAGPVGPVRRAAPSAWRCSACRSSRLRVTVTGDRRTAEELGRAFPGVPVHTSGRDRVLATVPAEPALVIATPGAEPVAERGYGAVLLLDGWTLLGRPDLRAGEETLRRWLAAAALARPASAGGVVVVSADLGLRPVQALVRWDPALFAAREAEERAEFGFPPATRVAAVDGPAAVLSDLLGAARLPAGAEVLGPVPVPPGAGQRADGPADEPGQESERLIIRVRREQGSELAAALRGARGVLDARRAPRPRIQLDPLMIG